MKHIQLAFNLTGRCNLECTYCATHGGELKVPDLKSEIIMSGYKEIRRKYPNSYLDLNCIGNGEPLLNWEAIGAIDEIRMSDNKTRCFITTNGTLKNKTLELAKRGWIVTISYDGIDHQFLRGKSEVVRDTITGLVKINAKFLVRMTITPESSDRLCESLNYIKKLGVEYIVLGPVFPFGRYKNKKSGSFFDINKLYKSLKYGEEINLKIILSIQKACTLATKGYYVMPDGGISICYIDCIEPSEDNRKKAYSQGCILYDYKKLL